MHSQSEVQAQVALRQIASPAADLVELHQVTGRSLHPRIQREAIAAKIPQAES